MIKITKFNGLEQAISMPIQIQESLDESLDLMYVELKNLDYNTPINMLKPVEIEITDGETTKTLNMVVESDEVVEVIKNKKYNHNIMLIEETKLAERYFVDKSVNQKLKKTIEIPSGIVKKELAWVNKVRVSSDPLLGGTEILEQIQINGVYNSYKDGDVFPSFDTFPGHSHPKSKEAYISFTDSFGNNIKYKQENWTDSILKDQELFENGIYKIRYAGLYPNETDSNVYEWLIYDLNFMYTSKGTPNISIKGNNSYINTEYFIKRDVFSYYSDNTIILPSAEKFIENKGLSYYKINQINIIDKNGKKIDYFGGVESELLIYTTKEKEDNIYYITERFVSEYNPEYFVDVKFEINYIYDKKIKSDSETVEEVINTLCITTESIRQSEMPKYSLAKIHDYNRSDEYKRKVEEIYNSTCPEFSFAKMSLFEALMQIGGRFNFQPRIRNNKIYLDLLGNEERISNIGKYYSNVKTQSSNNFCSKLDSFASNITGVENYEDGTDITPMLENYKTVRAEYGQTQITDDNIIFATEYPIEKPIKLEVGYFSDYGKVGDITAYLYEDSEYNLLSSYDNKYGAKNHAIKYIRGQKNITGLNYKRDVPALEGFTNYIAIKNIILNKLGLSNLDINFQELQFRLIYVPIIDARITQLNAYKSLGSEEIALSYNQNASKISSNAYGDNLKTNVSMMGNIDCTKMFKLPKLSMLPEIGQRYNDDYVITTIKSEYYPNFIKCELGLTENYTRKNEYIGLDSNLDIHELDRQNAINRHIIYEDICEISSHQDYSFEEKDASLITEKGLQELAYTFENRSEYTEPKISYVVATGYDENENSLGSFDIPLVSLGFGNSMTLIYSYPDAVFTEPSVAYRKQGFIESLKGAFREQYYSRYTDEYGKLDTLKLEYATPDGTPENYSSAVNIGNKFPIHQDILNPIKFFSTGNDKIQVKKDTGEKLSITYQLHFVKSELSTSDYIIGSALASRNNLISGRNSYRYQLYFLKDKVNKNQDKVSLVNAVEGENLQLLGDKPGLHYFTFWGVRVPDGEYKSWAIVDIKNGDNNLILAENKTMKGGDYVNMPYFNFRHKRSI